MSNLTTKSAHISIDRRHSIVSTMSVAMDSETAISTIREMGITNPVETDKAWQQFYSTDENGHKSFHTQLLKKFLFEHGFMTAAQLNNEKCTCKEIATAVYKCMAAGIFPIKCTKQTGIKGYTPIRLSRDFSGKMRDKWAFSSLSLVNPFCLARMKNPDLVCFYCYVEDSLKQNIVGMLNYIQNFFFMTNALLPDILIPVINPINLKLRDGIRIESFGDIASYQHEIFYIKLCDKNPLFHFTQWSKNPAIVCKAFDNVGKPENLKFGLSSSRINKLDNDLYRWILTGYIDFIFTVADNEISYQEIMEIPMARKCMCEEYSCSQLCKGCYLAENILSRMAKQPVHVVEKLRK